MNSGIRGVGIITLTLFLVFSLSKSVTMITVTYAAVIGILPLIYFVVWPVFEYFRDPKGMYLPTSLLIPMALMRDRPPTIP
jgi:hypothetical protein